MTIENFWEKPAANDEGASGPVYYYRARYYDPEIGRFPQEDPIGFAGGINFYAYCNNNPINCNDPMGKLGGPFGGLNMQGSRGSLQNFISTGQIGDPDLIQVSNFSNRVGVTGTALAAAPFVAGDAAGLLPAIGSGANAVSGSALTSGVISGTTSALGTFATGGNAEQALVNGVAGFTAGLFVPGIKVQGFTGNFAKGAGLAGAANAGAQSFNILNDPNKSFSNDFNVGEFVGSSLGGGFALGLTAPFGKSIPEQVSAGIFGFGPSTAFSAIGSSLGQPSASGGFVLYPSKPNTNTLRSVYAK